MDGGRVRPEAQRAVGQTRRYREEVSSAWVGFLVGRWAGWGFSD